eukprot:1137674-Pelagomonas_calceolata.AAC.2
MGNTKNASSTPWTHIEYPGILGGYWEQSPFLQRASVTTSATAGMHAARSPTALPAYTYTHTTDKGCPSQVDLVWGPLLAAAMTQQRIKPPSAP